MYFKVTQIEPEICDTCWASDTTLGLLGGWLASPAALPEAIAHRSDR